MERRLWFGKHYNQAQRNNLSNVSLPPGLNATYVDKSNARVKWAILKQFANAFGASSHKSVGERFTYKHMYIGWHCWAFNGIIYDLKQMTVNSNMGDDIHIRWLFVWWQTALFLSTNWLSPAKPTGFNPFRDVSSWRLIIVSIIYL